MEAKILLQENVSVWSPPHIQGFAVVSILLLETRDVTTVPLIYKCQPLHSLYPNTNYLFNILFEFPPQIVLYSLIQSKIISPFPNYLLLIHASHLAYNHI